MVRSNYFQEIIGAFFAIIVFIMIGSVMVTSLGDPIGLTGVFSAIFVIGGLAIGLALIIKVLKLFNLV